MANQLENFCGGERIFIMKMKVQREIIGLENSREDRVKI